MRSLQVPAGSYLVFATGEAALADVVVDGSLKKAGVLCRIDPNGAGTKLETPFTGNATSMDLPFTLVDAKTFSSTITYELRCGALHALEGQTMEIRSATLRVIQLASETEGTP